MKTISEYTELAIPDYALSYLVNGDASGLEDSDRLVIDEYMAQFYAEASKEGGSMIFDCGDGESYFTWHPEFGKSVSNLCISIRLNDSAPYSHLTTFEWSKK